MKHQRSIRESCDNGKRRKSFQLNTSWYRVEIHNLLISLTLEINRDFIMSNGSSGKKSYTCVLVIDVEAPNREKAAERFVNEIEQGWISPEDVQIE